MVLQVARRRRLAAAGAPARSWRQRSGSCSPRTAAGTARRGSPPICARPAGGSARRPSRRSCASSAWSPGPRSGAGDTTRQGKGRWRAPDLIGRDFPASRLNQKWYGDGTEIVTDEGKLYLDSVLDMGSRRVVGFALGEHHDAELAYAALAMAVAVRGGKEAIAGVIMHTDQGSEYTAKTFRAACSRLGIKQSMGRVGSALDNAVIESWHSHAGVRAAPPRALRHQGPGPRPGRGLDRRVQPRPETLALSACAARSTTSSRCATQASHRRPRGRGMIPAPASPRAWRRPRRRQGQALRVACGQP